MKIITGLVAVLSFAMLNLYAGGSQSGGDTPPAKPNIILVGVESGTTDTDGSYSINVSNVSNSTTREVWENNVRRYQGPGWGTSFNHSNGTYQYKVRACNSAGCSAFSSVVTVTVNILPADYHKVVGNIDGINSNSEIWGWTCAKDHAASIQYHVYVGGPAGTGTYVGQGVANQTITSGVSNACRTSGVPHRFKYKFLDSVKIAHAGKGIYVHGISPFGLPNYSINNGGKYKVPVAKPEVPGAMSVPSSDSDGVYTVTTGSAARVSTYEIDENKNGGNWTRIHSGSSRSQNVSGKSNGTYGYRARACNVSGCSGYNAAKYVVVDIPPPAPGKPGKPYFTSTVASDLDDNGSYTVKWSAASGVVDYYQLKENSSTISPITGTSKPISGKGNNTSYSYQVRACNASDCSDWSSSSSVSVKFRPAASGFNQCQSPQAANQTVTVSWSNSSYATRYQLLHNNAVVQNNSNRSKAWFKTIAIVQKQ